MASGPVDYGLFVGRKLCGVIEAKPEGTTLSGFSEQAARYIAGVPQHLVRDEPASVLLARVTAAPSVRYGTSKSGVERPLKMISII